jgi:hypothetical protein
VHDAEPGAHDDENADKADDNRTPPVPTDLLAEERRRQRDHEQSIRKQDRNRIDERDEFESRNEGKRSEDGQQAPRHLQDGPTTRQGRPATDARQDRRNQAELRDLPQPKDLEGVIPRRQVFGDRIGRRENRHRPSHKQEARQHSPVYPRTGGDLDQGNCSCLRG